MCDYRSGKIGAVKHTDWSEAPTKRLVIGAYGLQWQDNLQTPATIEHRVRVSNIRKVTWGAP